jgi:hypothetical protein
MELLGSLSPRLKDSFSCGDFFGSIQIMKSAMREVFVHIDAIDPGTIVLF